MKLLKQIIRLQALNDADTKLKTTLKIYGLGLLVLLGFSILKTVSANYGLYSNYSHPVTEALIASTSVDRVLYILVSAAITTPLMEELSFRLWLSKNRYRFFAGIAFLMVFLLLVITDLDRLLPVSPKVSFELFFLFVGGVLSYIFFQIFKKEVKLPSTSKLIIISSIFFAFIHLNVIGEQSNIFAYLIILLPYFISGYFYGYINWRIGFRYAFLAHGLHNLTLVSMTLLFN